MKRTLALILSAFLLLGMIPSTFLTALAVGPGVMGNGTTNQSYNRAPNQEILETVIIDGKVDTDVAWATHKWNEVDAGNGTWDKESPPAESKKLTYKYQLHYDYEYFYGAIVLGKDIKDAEITVWLNTNNGSGYTHKVVFSVANGAVTDGGMVDVNGSQVGDAKYNAQKYLTSSQRKDGKVTIEFRRYLDTFTKAADAADAEYFISVKYNKDSLYHPRIKIEGELSFFEPTATYWPSSEENTLTRMEDLNDLSSIKIDGEFNEAVWLGLTDYYHGGNGSNIDFENVGYNDTYQPSANSDSDIFLAYRDANGKLTDRGSSTDKISLNNSKGKGEVKFKYVYRVDAEYFYCAIIAEVPELRYNEIHVEGQNPSKTSESSIQTIYATPTLTIYFFNQTYKGFDGSKDGNDISSQLKSLYEGWVPEHMLSINVKEYNVNHVNAHELVNVSPRIEGNGYVDGVRWTTAKTDDTYGHVQSENESAYSYQGVYYDEADTYKDDANNEQRATSHVWHFETRIKLEDIMSSKALKDNEDKGLEPGDAGFSTGDLKFSISVSDRPWIEPFTFTDTYKNEKITGYKYYENYPANKTGQYVIGKNYYRNSAWTGNNTRVTNYPYYDAINAIDISNHTSASNYVSGITIDSNFDKLNNAELIAADSRLNGIDREVKDHTKLISTIKDHGKYNAGGYDIPSEENGLLAYQNVDNKFLYKEYTGIQYTYNVTADHEYLYFAIALKNLKDKDTFRIWVTKPGSTKQYDHAIEFKMDLGKEQKLNYCSWYDSSNTDNNNVTDKHTMEWADSNTQSSGNLFGYDYNQNNNLLYAEVRILLTDLGITPTLNPTENDILFYYFMSVEDSGNRYGTNGNYGLVSPRPAEGNKGYPANANKKYAGRVYYKETIEKSTIKNESARPFDHYDSTMLDYIKIDGKLDEEIWNEENKSERIVVNGDNGKWTVSPVKNESFEYSHVLYTGDNFIYGAVELDDEAILKSSSQTKIYTRIQLWLANPGAKDGWGEYENGAKYDNYSYTIYLAENGYTEDKSVKVEGPSGQQMCGLSTPEVRRDDFKWAITTANGKTYVEFMVATESYSAKDPSKSLFYMNQEAEYFISVKHGANEFYDGVNDKNAELTLNYPTPDETFYLTHFEVPSAEGAGVIYTDFSANGKYFSANGKWWMHVMFKAAPASSGWEIVGIRDGSTASANSEGNYGFTTTEIQQAGADFIYCVNVGNNYISVVNEVKTKYDNWLKGDGKNATEEEKRAKINSIVVNDMKSSIDTYFAHEKKAALHVNFSSIPAYYMSQTIEKTWEEGRIVCIKDLNPKSKETVAAQVQTMLQKQDQAQVEISITRYFKSAATPYEEALTEEKASFFKPDQKITHSLGKEVLAKPLYHEAGYKFIFTYNMYDPNPKYKNNFPTTSVWYQYNAGKLEKQKKTTPETILVDGILNDTGWDDDGWITVNEKINATAQISTADSFSYKYQIRNDGKYLYVAAVLENVSYDSTNRPAFTLWIKNGDAQTWTKYFRVEYINTEDSGYADGATIPKVNNLNGTNNRYQSDDIINILAGSASDNIKEIFKGLETTNNNTLRVINEEYEEYRVLYNNSIEAVKNGKNGSNASKLNYHDSAIYGYTETIEEYIKGFWYPDIRMEVQKYEFGKQAGVMKSDEDSSINDLPRQDDKSSVVEFRVALDEIDPNRQGFEYFVSATRKNGNGGEYSLYYPTVYCEPESEFSYYNDHFPFKKWYSETAIKVTPEDLKGDMYLANDYAPVVTLGAKFNDNFEGTNAIRFGAVYNEDLIRRKSGAENLDYWHVYDMGMLIAPTQKLDKGIDEFNSDAEYVERISSIGIENHIPDTNFADYESFVFYVTVYNIPDTYKKVKFSARPYIDYYNDFSDVDIYYGSAIERSMEMISNNSNQD